LSERNGLRNFCISTAEFRCGFGGVKGEKSGVITHGDTMIAAFTFNLSDLVARLEETRTYLKIV